MVAAPTTLALPLEVPVNRQQLVRLLREEPADVPRLLVVQEVREGAEGTSLLFREGGEGRIDPAHPHYFYQLRLARSSQEGQHPVGVRFGDRPAIVGLIRADNDVPTELWDETRDCVRVLFQGHDGLFGLKRDHPDFERLHAALVEGIRQQAPVWFISENSDLALLDVQAAEEAAPPRVPEDTVSEVFTISFVVAPEHLRRSADEILKKQIMTTKAIRRAIRAVAKAYLDEADELNRAVRELRTNARVAQIQSLSPAEVIEKARRLSTVQLANKELQEKVRKVADSYVIIAEKNQQLFNEFKDKYRNKLPKTT